MKNSVDDLAIFGGSKAFTQPLHVGKPNLCNKEKVLERVEQVLDGLWFTNRGPFLQEFEKKLAEYVGVKHCIAMCNATIALGIATRALDIEGEVIVPGFTFIATAHALKWQEITPVFCDIDPASFLIDPSKIEELITPRTSAIVGVHLWGRPCDVEALESIAKRHNLKIVFDAAHAFGCTYKGQLIGAFGDCEVLSFHATKFINTFEGGAVTTNNDELAEKIRLMQNYGFAGRDKVIYIGTNGKMSEVCAAMGVTGLEEIDVFIDTNRRYYLTYKKELSKVSHVSLLEFDESESTNYQYIVLDMDINKLKLSRDQIVSILHAENVLARRYFFPGCHRMEPYRSHFPSKNQKLPVTEALCDRVLCLPTGTAMTEDLVKSLCSLLEYIISCDSEIAWRLS